MFLLTGHKLHVINMNQQSDTADLLGGYVLFWQSDLTKALTKNPNINILFWFCRETDKLLFGVFTQFFFWNTQKKFKQGVSKSHMNFTNTQLKSANTQ